MNGLKQFTSDFILISLSAFLLSMLLTPIIRKFCQRHQLFDFPTVSRKIHTNPIPRLGGIAIYIAFFLPLFAVFLTDGTVADLFGRHLDILLGLWATSTLVFAIGVYDDVYGATVTQKFVVQCVAAALIYFLGFRIQEIAMPFFGGVSLGILGLPITMLWVVGVTNALNFVDGIDGLASGVGFFSVSTMFILSIFLHNSMTAFFAAALAGAIFGFTLYNFAPASIFMGDSGSLFIGFIIAVISLHGSQKSSTAVVLLLPVIALGVPIADTILAIVRRVAHGLSPFSADKEHIHHRLLRLGFSSRQVVLVLYAVCTLLGVTALAMTAVNDQVLALILIALGVVTIGGMKMLGYTADMVHINSLAKERIQQKRRLWQRQKFTEDILLEVESAVDILTLQKSLIKYFEHMDLDVGKLTLSVPRGESEQADGMASFSRSRSDIVWYSPRYECQEIPRTHVWTIDLPIVVNAQAYGQFQIGRYSLSESTFLDDVWFVNKLRYSVEKTLSRIHAAASEVS